MEYMIKNLINPSGMTSVRCIDSKSYLHVLCLQQRRMMYKAKMDITRKRVGESEERNLSLEKESSFLFECELGFGYT